MLNQYYDNFGNNPANNNLDINNPDNNNPDNISTSSMIHNFSTLIKLYPVLRYYKCPDYPKIDDVLYYANLRITFNNEKRKKIASFIHCIKSSNDNVSYIIQDILSFLAAKTLNLDNRIIG